MTMWLVQMFECGIHIELACQEKLDTVFIQFSAPVRLSAFEVLTGVLNRGGALI